MYRAIAYKIIVNHVDIEDEMRLSEMLLETKVNIQAQRDYFGAHSYERIDRPRGDFFHTNWTGEGGTTSASTYVV